MIVGCGLRFGMISSFGGAAAALHAVRLRRYFGMVSIFSPLRLIGR